MNFGKTLFAQLMEFVPWTSFARIVSRYSGDARISALPSTEHVCLSKASATHVLQFRWVYASAFRKKLYTSLDQLQSAVDEWLKFYNEERTHSGKHCFGKTPWQTFLDSKELATTRKLDRTYQTTEPIATAS
jgi:hypothetical protein